MINRSPSNYVTFEAKSRQAMLTQEIKDSLHKLSQDELQEIQEEVISLLNPLARAKQRGKQYQQQSIQDALSDRDAATLLNISVEDLDRLRQSNEIVFLSDGNSYVYPKCQFDGGKIINGIDRVIAELPLQEGWTQLIFLESGDPMLGGEKPIDRLRSGDLPAVISAAGNYGRQRPV
jgi:hypothetical protein